MPQIQLPFFPQGTTEINRHLAIMREGDQATYIYGHMPVFSHDVGDVKTFRMFTSQLYVNGSVKQSEIISTFGVAKSSVKRGVKVYREEGAGGFYEKRKGRGASVLTGSVLEEAQQLFDEGMEIKEVAERLSIKKDTIRKGVESGRLHAKKSKSNGETTQASTKSERSVEDSLAPMGMGATNTLQRIAASIGQLNAVEPSFRVSLDVPNGGVLFALPALLASGLLSHAEKYFQLRRGYYRLDSIFLLLAFMTLARLKTVERLRFRSPGEWGKLLGLDRIPEAKTLREKIGHLSNNNQPSKWAAELSAEWMKADPESASVLYIDGHVRVYSGKQTKLPRHYVARQRLCLRATTDYWVNAMDGQPFFLVNKEVDPGLIKVMEEEILPRLEREVPNQPTQKQLEEDPLLHRFSIIFDREGYSPEFFLRMKEKRIACMTYHKYPGEDWAEEEFIPHRIELSSGNAIEIKLAERGTFIGKKLWVREIRKLTDSGHQTSVLSTDYRSNLKVVAVAMFSRWSQENFLKYMRLHYNLDRLVEYSTEDIPETTKVINPEYRRIESEIKKKTAILNHRKAKFGAITLNDDIEPKKVHRYQQKKGELKEEINHLEKEIEPLKDKRKTIHKHITFAQLPEQERFSRLSTQSKYFVDTIKMIAYRAETAMVSILRETMSHPDEARSLLRGIYNTEADIIPDKEAGTLTVRLHQMANHCSSESTRHLCDELNATETVFPGTNLRLIYELVS